MVFVFVTFVVIIVISIGLLFAIVVTFYCDNGMDCVWYAILAIFSYF